MRNMRIYIANKGETLSDIARRYNTTLDVLIFLNPHVTGSDVSITGLPVKLPPFSKSTENLEQETSPPFQTDIRNEWIPLTPLEQMTENDYDVLIVGSGAGGGAVLWRLCQQWGGNGKKIGVVEAGDLLLPTHFYNIPTYTLPRFRSYLDKVSKRIPQINSKELIAFGGRTLVWQLLAPRMPVFETTGWPFPANELQFYYSIAERIMKVTPFYQEGSSFTTILLNRLHEQGYQDAFPMPIAVDREPTKYGQIHSNAAFSSIALFAEALNRCSFDLAINSRAVEIITEKKRVTGVKVMSADKRSYVLKAKTVVLSASTLQNPRLLLASGIPGRAIGHYLTPHSAVVQPRYLDRKQFPEVLGALGILIPSREDRPYQVSIGGPAVGYNAYQQYQIKPMQEQLEIATSTSGAVESRYDNRIELDTSVRDEYGVPVIRIHFSFSETDQAVIRLMQEGLRQIGSVLQAPPATEGNFGIDRPIIEGNHVTGTCRMGIDPDTSATDPYGQIHGISGLYVADNSVIPSSGTANPTLTTVALAIRTADHLIRQLK
jgi:choline dehydrogenase-like flavoprotein